MQKPSPNLCKEWRESAATKWLLNEIESSITEIAERASRSGLSYHTEFETAKKAIECTAQIAALELVYDAIDNISEEMDYD